MYCSSLPSNCIESKAWASLDGQLVVERQNLTKWSGDEVDEPKDSSQITGMRCGQTEMVIEVSGQHIIGCELNSEGEAVGGHEDPGPVVPAS